MLSVHGSIEPCHLTRDSARSIATHVGCSAWCLVRLVPQGGAADSLVNSDLILHRGVAALCAGVSMQGRSLEKRPPLGASF